MLLVIATKNRAVRLDRRDGFLLRFSIIKKNKKEQLGPLEAGPRKRKRRERCVGGHTVYVKKQKGERKILGGFIVRLQLRSSLI